MRRYVYAFLTFIVFAAGWMAYPAVAGSGAPPKAASIVKVVRPMGHGSGVHVGGGFFLTAAHVIDDAKTVSLKTSDNKTLPAEVLWRNVDYDIALLRAKPDGIAVSKLACRTVGDSEIIKASGNPLSLEFVSVYGHISGKARELAPWKSVYVTDLTTVMGMSGGPTFDERGEVIGITVGVAPAPLKYGNGWVPSLTGFGMVVPSAEVCRLLGRSA